MFVYWEKLCSISGKKWAGFPVLARDERGGGAERGQASADGSPHGGGHLLRGLPAGVGVEV